MKTILDIPPFVGRGLATMDDPARGDWRSVRYRTEADLRDAMATLWWLHGWDVRTEVKIPSCGRIDVLATSLNCSVIIELKRSIRTTTQARQAFQQAHAYHAFTERSQIDSRNLALPWDEQSHVLTFVSAGDYEWSALWAADDAYREVSFRDFGNLADLAWKHFPMGAIPDRCRAHAVLVARSRRIKLGQLASASRAAELLSVQANEGDLDSLATGGAA